MIIFFRRFEKIPRAKKAKEQTDTKKVVKKEGKKKKTEKKKEKIIKVEDEVEQDKETELEPTEVEKEQPVETEVDDIDIEKTKTLSKKKDSGKDQKSVKEHKKKLPKESELVKVGDQIQEPLEEPVEEPIEESVEKQDEKPSTKPDDKPMEKITEKPAEKPAKEPTKKPTEEPIIDQQEMVDDGEIEVEVGVEVDSEKDKKEDIPLEKELDSETIELDKQEISSIETEGKESETPKSGLEELELKLLDYNDFLPNKDTVTVITHLDVDGVLCVAAISKMLESTKKKDVEGNNRMRVFFTSPTKIFSTLAKTIPDLNKIQDDDFQIGKLYICDLSINRDTLMGASIYDQMKWFDHHEVDSDEQFDRDIDNTELVVDPTASSATSIVCNYFKLDSQLSKIADEVDTNNISNENAKRIGEIIGGLKLKYSGTKLKRFLYTFANELAKDINSIDNEIYNTLIEDYNKWLEDFKKIADEKIQIHNINDNKIGILETENVAPVYAIYNSLKNHTEAPFDIIAVMIHKYFRIGKDRNNKFKNKRFTKLEFRTHSDKDLLELAKLFGGGGHKFASGATVMDGLDVNELLKNIEAYYIAPPKDKNK